MIIYSENQLDDAWQHDCRMRSLSNRMWITRTKYEKLFVYYLQSLIDGDEFIKLDIYIPEYILDNMDQEIDIYTEERLH